MSLLCFIGHSHDDNRTINAGCKGYNCYSLDSVIESVRLNK